ncbi:DUF5790 family protein [Halovenus rubra]|uniref:DUF5790 family protein n=2 Tax=Halovenus rubra TaxID=869890 RepID=A0ABD5X036_9EURY|nr:DUF5790 family protein [Halovenus rubra]
MSQATLDDDELFTEAASEMREDVESSLEAARDSLPEAEAVWDVDSENTLGVLNALRSALDVGDAREDLHDAKKWFTMGKKADAFEDSDDLATEIEEVEELLGDIEDASEQVGDLASTVPQLKNTLEKTDDEADAEAAEA